MVVADHLRVFIEDLSPFPTYPVVPPARLARTTELRKTNKNLSVNRNLMWIYNRLAAQLDPNLLRLRRIDKPTQFHWAVLLPPALLHSSIARGLAFPACRARRPACAGCGMQCSSMECGTVSWRNCPIQICSSLAGSH